MVVGIERLITRMLQKAELRQIRIHDLRHMFASLLLQQGESIVYVKETPSCCGP